MEMHSFLDDAHETGVKTTNAVNQFDYINRTTTMVGIAQ